LQRLNKTSAKLTPGEQVLFILAILNFTQIMNISWQRNANLQQIIDAKIELSASNR
jgi:hypothetical protein